MKKYIKGYVIHSSNAKNVEYLSGLLFILFPILTVLQILPVGYCFVIFLCTCLFSMKFDQSWDCVIGITFNFLVFAMKMSVGSTLVDYNFVTGLAMVLMCSLELYRSEKWVLYQIAVIVLEMELLLVLGGFYYSNLGLFVLILVYIFKTMELKLSPVELCLLISGFWLSVNDIIYFALINNFSLSFAKKEECVDSITTVFRISEVGITCTLIIGNTFDTN